MTTVVTAELSLDVASLQPSGGPAASGPTTTHENTEEVALTREVVRQSLSLLGHNRDGHIVYTQCLLAGRQLRCIALLGNYRHLQRITLDHNQLRSLTPLRALDSLVYLSATHNELDASVFSDLCSSSCTLERLYLDHNKLDSLDGLQQLPYLIDFGASHNVVNQMLASHFASLSSLMRLDLSANCVAHVEPHCFDGARQVRCLLLSHNAVEDLCFTAYLTDNLDTLLVAHNNVRHIGSPITACKALVHLDLSWNHLLNLEELQGLREVITLRQLGMIGNPCFPPSEDPAIAAVIGGKQQQKKRKATPKAPPTATGEANKNDETEVEMTAAAATEEGEEDEEQLRPLSRSEVAASDVEAARPDTATYTAAATTTTINGAVAVDFAALSEAHTRGLVRHVVTAAPLANVPIEVDVAEEVARLPPTRRAFLRALFLLPQLAQLDRTVITPEDVARAGMLFPASDSRPGRSD